MKKFSQYAKLTTGLLNALLIGLTAVLSIFVMLAAFPWLPFHGGDGLASLILIPITISLFFFSILNWRAFTNTKVKTLVFLYPFVLGLITLGTCTLTITNIGNAQSLFMKIFFLSIVLIFTILACHAVFLLIEQSIISFKQKNFQELSWKDLMILGLTILIITFAYHYAI